MGRSMSQSITRGLDDSMTQFLTSGSPHLKRHAVHDAPDDRRPPVVLRSRLANDLANGRPIARRHGTAERVCEQLFGHRGDVLLLVREEQIAQAGWPVE